MTLSEDSVQQVKAGSAELTGINHFLRGVSHGVSHGVSSSSPFVEHDSSR